MPLRVVCKQVARPLAEQLDPLGVTLHHIGEKLAPPRALGLRIVIIRQHRQREVVRREPGHSRPVLVLLDHPQTVTECQRLNPQPLAAVIPCIYRPGFVYVYAFVSRQAQQHVVYQPARNADTLFGGPVVYLVVAVVLLEMPHDPGLHFAVRYANVSSGREVIELAPPVPQRKVTSFDSFVVQIPQQLRMQRLAVVRFIIRRIPDALNDKVIPR